MLGENTAIVAISTLGGFFDPACVGTKFDAVIPEGTSGVLVGPYRTIQGWYIANFNIDGRDLYAPVTSQHVR